jgi:L-ascorbate metabolism protein UlaG (beta-lactamase superfamily)
MKRSTRRALLAGAVATAGIAALEYGSLSGRFDHRRRPASQDSTSRFRYATSIATLDADARAAAGAIVQVGHSTHLIAVAGMRMLTDPWFGDPAFGAMSHTAGPATSPEEIGRLDAILVTHDHADHLDPPAVDRLDKRALAVVGTKEIAARMRSLGFSRTEVVAPWAALEIGGARVTAVPAIHDIYEIGFVVEGAGHRVYFAGDTRLFEGIAAIAERLSPTFALLPVDGTRLIGGDLHVMTPADAVQAARTLKVPAVMPSHAEAEFTDPLVDHVIASTVAEAPAKFAAALASALPGVRCHIPAAGALLRL